MNARLLRAARLRFKHARTARSASRRSSATLGAPRKFKCTRGACELGWRWPSVRPRD